MAAFGEGDSHVEIRHVRMAIADTESVRRSRFVAARVLRYFSSLVATIIASIGVILLGGRS
jgi:hypothetical protein